MNDNFCYYIDHLKFVISTLVKLTIFFDNSLRIENNLWGIRNLEEFGIEGKKMIFIKKILLVCLKIIFLQFIEKLLFKFKQS